jgi:pimeloyl-ACP methyl ester carboxylesterase
MSTHDGRLDHAHGFLDHRAKSGSIEGVASGGMTNTRGEQVSDSATVATYVGAETQLLTASSGVEYAYRATGTSDGTPLVMLQHFRGNLDNWDPALIDALAAGRRVITFDNRGVAASSGTTPSTIAEMALDASDFIDALGVGEVDLVGFSIGSFVAQEIALVRPSIVRKLVLASSAPQGASGMHGWAADVIGAVGKPETSAEDYLSVFFTNSQASRAAGQQVAGRVFGARTVDRDAATSWQTRLAQYDAVCAWGLPNHSLLERLSAIDKPVFVTNGDSDPMILPRYSYLLAGLIPEARLKIYPDAAHGFLFQHHAEFAADVDAFLAGA